MKTFNIKVLGFNQWDNYRECLYINGEEKLFVCDLSNSPEDAIIGRNLTSCDELARIILDSLESFKTGGFSSIKYDFKKIDGDIDDFEGKDLEKLEKWIAE